MSDSAREFLVNSFPLYARGQIGVIVDIALEKHAHELAEMIRREADKRDVVNNELEAMGMWRAADLIDTEKPMSNEHEPTPDGEDGGQNQEVHDQGQQSGHDEPHPGRS